MNVIVLALLSVQLCNGYESVVLWPCLFCGCCCYCFDHCQCGHVGIAKVFSFWPHVPAKGAMDSWWKEEQLLAASTSHSVQWLWGLRGLHTRANNAGDLRGWSVGCTNASSGHLRVRKKGDLNPMAKGPFLNR